MRILSIDLETYSAVDIRKAGLYRYAENAEILLFAYAWDDEPVHVVDFTAGETLPNDVMVGLWDEGTLKTAYNAAFEMHVLNQWVRMHSSKSELPAETAFMKPAQWFCTMVQGYTLGLPGGLGAVGKALGIPEDKQKLATGKRLIQYFCKPCKPTKANGGRTRNYPLDDPEKWELFKTYNAQDVEAERAIRKRIEWAFPNKTERRLWCLDQAINDRGVLIDQRLIREAVAFDASIKEEAMDEARKLTGMPNPNSNVQALDWFEEQEGYRPATLDKKFRAEYLTNGTSEKVKEFFRLKNLLAKTSVKKYEAMQNMVCRDGRVHGMLQFYGAQRTGRWAGRGVQLHNLPQNHMEDLDDARQIVRQGDYDFLSCFYDNPSDVLSQLIRTAFIAKPGCRFIVADFSAIEARVIAWLADEKWRQEAFANGEDIYCASATQMFGVPVVKHGINGELRQKGKVAELACGYGGGVNALKAFGADKMGLSEAAMQEIVDKWRERSPHIVAMWRDMEKAAKRAIRHKGVIVKYHHGVTFQTERGCLFMQLPSGRRIAYCQPSIKTEDGDYFQKESITYKGVIQASGGWGAAYTWGGKIVENCLAEGTPVLTDAGLVPIEQITADRLVWDGYEWCRHEGLVPKGKQNVLHVDGLLMTENHQVLTKEGWKKAHECKGLDWADVPLPDGHPKERNLQREKGKMALPLCLREPRDRYGNGPDEEKASDSILRLHEKEIDRKGAADTRDDNIRVLGKDGDRAHDNLLSSGASLADGIVVREAGFQKPVYDIRNCGSRHQFTVYDPLTREFHIVHNCVQATARDCLAAAMLRLDAAGYPIVMHVHDEVILEMPEGKGSLADAVRIMCEPIPWAEGLLLNADGYETKYYRKD